MQVIVGTRNCFGPGRFLRLFLVGILLGTSLRGVAQNLVLRADEDSAATELPDAPQPQNQDSATEKPLVAAAPKTVPASTTMPTAPMFSRVIPAGMATPQIHKWDKMELAARNLYSATAFFSIAWSAGWSHLTNGQPNYGTNSAVRPAGGRGGDPR